MLIISISEGVERLKVILIDDEPLALEILERQLKKFDGIEVIEKFTYFDITVHENLLKSVDLVFLDIEMPELNGFELAEKIMEVCSDISIVFVTAYNEYAVKAFELNVMDYILKPVQKERLKNTLQRVQSDKNSKEEPIIKDETNLIIRVGNELSFEINGRLKNINWRTTKAKEIFFYLLHHEGTAIRKDFLAEYFWPDLEIEKAFSQMYTAIYHIRKALRSINEHITIKSRQEGYVLFLENAEVDLLNWESQLSQFHSFNRKKIHAYENTLEKYPGSYLGGENYIWAESERYRLEELWLASAYQIATHYMEDAVFDKAQKWYNNICNVREDEEKAHFQLMKLYDKQDNKQMVQHQYKLLSNIYKELNIPINSKIIDWYENWRKHGIYNQKM